MIVPQGLTCYSRSYISNHYPSRSSFFHQEWLLSFAQILVLDWLKWSCDFSSFDGLYVCYITKSNIFSRADPSLHIWEKRPFSHNIYSSLYTFLGSIGYYFRNFCICIWWRMLIFLTIFSHLCLVWAYYICFIECLKGVSFSYFLES